MFSTNERFRSLHAGDATERSVAGRQRERTHRGCPTVTRRSALVVLTVAVAAGLLTAGALAVTAQERDQRPDRGEPDLDVTLPENEVTPGTETTLELDISNDGRIISGSGSESTTARSTSVEITDDGPFEVKTGPANIGTVPDSETVPATQRIAVPDDIEPGEYDIRVETEYTYNRQVSGDGSVSRTSDTDRHTVTIVVPDEPRFDVTAVQTDVEPGASGDVTIEIANTGTDHANRTQATITGGTGVTIDGGAAEEVIGDLSPNASTTMTVDAAIEPSVSGGVKPLDVAFTYRDGSGIERDAPSETASLAPADQQSFSIDDLEDTLSVGYDGEVTGTLTNDGPRSVDDAVLIVEPQSDSLSVEDTRYALPELEPGEETQCRYPTDVSGQADPGPRQLQFSVEYTGGDRSTLTDGPISQRVEIGDRQDEFAISDDGVSVTQGESSEIELEVTNQRSETLSNIDARLYTDSPLDASNDEAFVPELEPGQSATMTFEIAADQDAATEIHPVELDFEYDTERGDTKLSDTYQHPIEVAAAPDEGGSILSTALPVLVVLSIAALGIGVWVRRR